MEYGKITTTCLKEYCEKAFMMCDEIQMMNINQSEFNDYDPALNEENINYLQKKNDYDNWKGFSQKNSRIMIKKYLLPL